MNLTSSELHLLRTGSKPSTMHAIFFSAVSTIAIVPSDVEVNSLCQGLLANSQLDPAHPQAPQKISLRGSAVLA